MNILREFNPEGTEICRSRKLCRRKCISPGHADGYDISNLLGLPIYKEIDGFSRKVVCLKVIKTTNSPSVVATYYVDAHRKSTFKTKN